MARKAKEVPHLRLRVEAALLSRLEKAASKNERTLTGEIVSRLEKSFEADERVALLRQAWTERLDDMQKRYAETLETIKTQASDAAERYRQHVEELETSIREMEVIYRQAEAAADTLDVLMGKNAASSNILRQIALNLAADPDWSANQSSAEAMISRLKHVDFYEAITGKSNNENEK